MSKIDRELKAVIDDMAEQANALIPKMLAIMVDDDKDDDDKIAQVSKLMQDAQPKTYDVYIADIKQIFRQAGWTEPDTTTEA
jgi:hypothetical protein